MINRLIEKIQKNKRRKKYNKYHNISFSPTGSNDIYYKGYLFIPLRELNLYCKFLKKKQCRKDKLMIMNWKNA